MILPYYHPDQSLLSRFQIAFLITPTIRKETQNTKSTSEMLSKKGLGDVEEKEMTGFGLQKGRQLLRQHGPNRLWKPSQREQNVV